MFPRSSGEYNFLSRAFHPAFGFLAGWVSAMVGFAAPVALAAMAFGQYGTSVWPGAPPLALAVGVVWLVSIVQLTGVRHSGSFQLIATILKSWADRRVSDRGIPRGPAADFVCA